MEKNAAAGRTPSSLPLSTPPPAALTGSSPEFAPLSPLHTNALNDAKALNVKSDPTNFNLPPSNTEDNRVIDALTSRGFTSENTLGDQRNERFVAGGKSMLEILVSFFFLIFAHETIKV